MVDRGSDGTSLSVPVRSSLDSGEDLSRGPLCLHSCGTHSEPILGEYEIAEACMRKEPRCKMQRLLPSNRCRLPSCRTIDSGRTTEGRERCAERRETRVKSKRKTKEIRGSTNAQNKLRKRKEKKIRINERTLWGEKVEK